LEEDEFRLVTISETKSQAGLTLVKAKTLSGIRLGSRIRSGNRVKAFSLVRAGRLGRVRVAGLSRLSSGKTKTSPRASFSLIPQTGLG
jgi:hypothetical protein